MKTKDNEYVIDIKSKKINIADVNIKNKKKSPVNSQKNNISTLF